MRWIGVLIVFAACHTGGTETPDAIEIPDGRTPRPGLFVTWRADPALPGPLTDKISVEEAMFQVEYLEVVGDSSGGTTRSGYRLTWSDAMTPPEDAFPNAPPGLYSQVGIRLSNLEDSNAYEIRGTWHDDDADRDWRFAIEDRASLFISLDCATTLPAAGTAAIAIALQLSDALGDIKFEELEQDDDELRLRSGDPQLVPFRLRLARAFMIE